MKERMLHLLEVLELSAREKRLLVLIFVLGTFLGVVVFVADNSSEVTVLERGNYGAGRTDAKLQVTLDGEESIKNYNMTIEIEERQYTVDEVNVIFQEIIEKLDKVVLGDNSSFDKVDKDLNLVEVLEDYPVEIEWSWSPHRVMNVEGQLQEINIPKDGELVELVATLSYGEETVQYRRNAMFYPPEKTGIELWIWKIEKAVEGCDLKSMNNQKFILPDKVDGVSVTWSKITDYRGVFIVILTMVAIGLWGYQKIEKKKEMEKKRALELILDYPEIVNRIVLLLGAGMTIKKAWSKILENCDKDKERSIYREMIITEREMENGITESEAYERFGTRCNVPCYRKLGYILSQNVRKGSKGLLTILEVEACEARELRKARARIVGETAATKLLMPMFMMLVVVLIVIVIPAFLTVQI